MAQGYIFVNNAINDFLSNDINYVMNIYNRK